MNARGLARQLGLVVLAAVLATVASVWIIKVYVFPSRFRPVTLSAKEESVLDRKLERLEGLGGRRVQSAERPGERLAPEPYSEDEASREITLSEREVNALVSRNPDLASRLAIDLSGDLVSARVLIPVDEDFPMFGGRTLRVRAGVVLDYRDERPVVAFKGVSVMGVPVPNAWLGGLKNIDLVEKFGGEEGVWKTFAAGVEDLEVSEGKLRIKLKE